MPDSNDGINDVEVHGGYLKAFRRQALLEWADRVRHSIDILGDATVLRGVDQATDALRSDRFCLAVLGKAKRGKSTLINALLGRRDDIVAPVDKLPASSAISRFRWAEAAKVTVAFRDGRHEQVGFDRIRDFVTEEGNKENSKGVDMVEIEGPFPGLSKDVVLVDTPGADSIHEYHDALLHAFIPQADAVIFLLTARMPLDQDELALLKKIKAADIQKVFFAINRVDESEAKDVEDAVAHNLQLLAQVGVHVDQIHRISAKLAFKGDIAGSGVQALTDEVAGFLTANKGRVVASRFVSRIKAVVEPIAQGLEVRLASSTKSTEELDSELSTLREKKISIQNERGIIEREFSNDWSKAADAFERKIRDAKGDIAGRIGDRITKTTTFDVSKLARELPTILTSTIEEELGPISLQFE